MPFLPASALRALCLTVVVSGLLAGTARADLVWDSNSGWRIEGGILSGLTGANGRDALDRMNKARKAEELHHYRTALKAYDKVVKMYPNSIYAPEAFYHTGNIWLARKRYLKAFDAYQQILTRYPNVKRFNELIEDQYRIASAMLDGARNRIWFGIPGFPSRELSIGCFEIILGNAPYSDYAPLVLMNIARGHQYLGNTDEAIDALDRLVNNYPQSVICPDAYLRLAKLHAYLVEGPSYDQAETKQAITYDEDFMILFPSDPKIAEAAQGLDKMKRMLGESKIKIADFYFYKRDNYTAARVFYNEAITSYPDSDVAKEARARLAEVEKKATAAAQSGGVRKKHFLFFF
ncbi:MAG: tetratricopeptide repeat protein [Opitutaceae bacterium]|jgi:outer membrane protein assembly factor BamD